MKIKTNPRKSRSRRARIAASQPRYDAGLRFDTPGLRYADTDPVPPVDGGAKVKLELALRNDDNLEVFTQAHIEAITGNPLYPTPDPLPAEFQAALDAYRATLLAANNAKLALKDATAQKDAARAVLEQLFDKRGLYVQTASNGNESAILSAGLPVRNPRTPTGQLPPPTNLQVHLNGVTGLMLLSWNPEPKAKSYSGRVSEAVTPRNWNPLPGTTKTKLQIPNMDVGKTYVFQVAAVGGSTGQSYWSPEVVRAAA